MAERKKGNLSGACNLVSRVKCAVAGLIIVCVVLVLGSNFSGASDVQLKYSPGHMMNSIPQVPADFAEAKIACIGIREMAENIDTRRIEAERLAGDDVNIERIDIAD